MNNSGTSSESEEETNNDIQTLASIYEKVCSALQSKTVEYPIDLYTLYDFVSFFLSKELLENQDFKSNYLNTMRLKDALSTIEERQLLFIFFENDKNFLAVTTLERAMINAKLQNDEKGFLQRKIHTFIYKHKKVRFGKGNSQEDEDIDEIHQSDY